MNAIKLVLMALGFLFAVVVLWFTVGLIFSAAYYLLLFGAVALAGYGAYRLLAKPEPKQLNSQSTAETELQKAQQVLKDYQRKLLKDRE